MDFQIAQIEHIGSLSIIEQEQYQLALQTIC